MIRNRFFQLFILMFFPTLTFSFNAFADTIYLKNGGVIEGIIKSEGKDTIELEIGQGTITLGKNEVAKIEKATIEEDDSLRDAWDRKRSQLDKRREEFLKERDRRFAEYGKWADEERRAHSKAGQAKEIQMMKDSNSRGLYVDALLNGKIKAALVIDTGASIVVLSNKIGRNLGIDLSDPKKDAVTLRLAGNRTIEAKMVLLKSVNIQDVEVKDVIAAVLLEAEKGLSFKDGLLGMSFLSKFNLRIDLKNMKMVLEKL